MKSLKLLVLFSAFQTINAFANSCPIAELEGQKFKVIGFNCNNTSDYCERYKNTVKAMVIVKGDEWGENDLFWVKYSSNPTNPLDTSGGFGFNSNQTNREDNQCSKSTNADGSITYNFYHNYCPNNGCSEQFIVTGNKATFTWGGSDRFVQYMLEKL